MVLAGLDKMDIRWILEEAACDCHRMDVEPGNPAFDPGFVINEARKVPATSVVNSNFMEAYCASLRTEIINGVDVRFPSLDELVKFKLRMIAVAALFHCHRVTLGGNAHIS